jgi:hypothetical protein
MMIEGKWMARLPRSGGWVKIVRGFHTIKPAWLARKLLPILT